LSGMSRWERTDMADHVTDAQLADVIDGLQHLQDFLAESLCVRHEGEIIFLPLCNDDMDIV
jgi:hypothetical protein